MLLTIKIFINYYHLLERGKNKPTIKPRPQEKCNRKIVNEISGIRCIFSFEILRITLKRFTKK
jgi:hypothetical protein